MQCILNWPLHTQINMCHVCSQGKEMFSLNAALDAINNDLCFCCVCVCDLNVLLELERKRTTASCGVCVCAFYCLFVCFVVRAVDWSGVSRFGRWDGYRRRALWCEVVKAEGWALMIHTSLRARKHSSEGQRSLSSTSLVSFPSSKPFLPSTSLSTPFTESDSCWASWAPLHKFMLISAMKTVPHLQIFVEQRSVHFLSLFYTSPFLTFSSSTIFSSFIFYYLFFQSPNLGRCGFHTWCEMLFLQRLLTHVCNVFFWGLDLS